MGRTVRIASLAMLLLLVPVAAMAAAGEGEHAGGFDWLLWTARILNALIFFGVILYFVTPILRDMLAGRQQAIRDELAQAERAVEEVRQQKAEAEAELKRLERDAATIRARATGEAEAERDRILADAERAAGRMIEMAEAQIEGAMREARTDLRKYATKLSGELAEEVLRKEITAKDKDTLFEEGVQSLEAGA